MESSLTNFDGINVTPLKRIYHPKGDIYHALKSTEESFDQFGEAYFTTIGYNDIKGWKLHKQMILNLIVPFGEVGFYFYEQETLKSGFIKIGSNNYSRLTVKPGIWMAFKGITDGLNLVLNIANISHDPKEAINVDLQTFPLKEKDVSK